MHYHTPKQKEKNLRIKNSSQILPKCNKQLYPALVAKDYGYEKNVHWFISLHADEHACRRW